MPSLPRAVSSGTSDAAGVSSASAPRSHSRRNTASVATGLVSDATSYTVSIVTASPAPAFAARAAERQRLHRAARAHRDDAAGSDGAGHRLGDDALDRLEHAPIIPHLPGVPPNQGAPAPCANLPRAHGPL